MPVKSDPLFLLSLTLSLSLSLLSHFRIIQKLPSENQLLLQFLIPLLHHITEEAVTNGMNSINLAICFAPSLLWPDSGLDVIKNEVPPLIQFMIEHSPEIFGHELPDLYQGQGILSPSPRSYRVPTKKTDGNLRVYRHRRNGSFDTSTSEDSAGEDDMPSNMLQMQRSGLTVSDSQVSVLSQQLEDEEYSGGLISGAGGDVSFSGGRHHEGFHHHLNPHSPKRQKKSRPPERSSSYRGPNERPYMQKYHVVVDEASRRKSIATQITLQERHTPHYVGMSASQGANTSTVSSSSLSQDVSPFIKSRQMQSFDENEEFNDEEDDLVNVLGRRHSQKRKRSGPSYHQSYSVDHIMGPSIDDPHKVSYYDHLPPLSPGEELDPGRIPGNLSLLGTHEGDSFETPMDEDDDDERWEGVQHSHVSSSGVNIESTPLHPILSSDRTVAASNQSIASRSSGSSGSHHYYSKLPQSRPSNLSLGSSVSESSYASTITKESPETERTPLNREMVKYEITRRFGIPSRGNSFTGSTYSASNGAGRSDSFNQEMDNIQRKFQERRRPDALNSVSTTSTTPHSGMESVSSPPSFDDRPESERHLHSLPRTTDSAAFIQSPPPQQTSREPSEVYRRSRSSAAVEGRRRRSAMEQDPSKLTVDNYDSDTESSPSRTLTRRDRLNEMARITTANSRYRIGQTTVLQGGIGRATLGTPASSAPATAAGAGAAKTRHPPLNEVSIIPANKEDENARSDAAKAALTQSLPTPQPQQQQQQEAKLSPSDKDINGDTANAIRPKSAQPNGKGDEDGYDNGMDFRKRTMSDVEKAKLRLGLIPPRRRSKSISDTRTGKSIVRPASSKQEEEEEEEEHEAESEQSQDELETNEIEKTDRLNKRGMWRAHAPNSTDRKEAYTQRMKVTGTGLNRTSLLQHGSVKANAPKAVAPPPPAIQRTATAPEMGGSKRRAATMPEYLVTRSAVPGRQQGRVLGRGLVRTVKITSYSIPEPRKIHRINIRTIH